MAWDFETEPEFQEQLTGCGRSSTATSSHSSRSSTSCLPDEWQMVKRHLQDQVKAQGLWGAFLDPELGGAGFGQLKLALMSEIIGRCMISMAIFGVQAPDSGNMELLAHGATEAQKERWLWPNLRGEISSAFALTEPFFAGADPTVIGTTAVKDGDEWVINGHKWFITNASCADIVLVFAETNPEGRPHRHASVFVVPAGTPGMNIVRDIPTMAPPRRRATAASATTPRSGSSDCRVPDDHLIGQPGEGFVLAQQRLGGGRIHHAMRWIGQAQRSLDIMCERAVSRTSHGKLLAQHQMIQDYIALSHMEIEAARLLTFQTAWKVDRFGAAAVRADLDGQGPRLEGRARRARPGHPDLRCARLFGRPAARGVVPHARGSAPSATAPTRSTSPWWPARCSSATRPSRAGRPSTSRAVGRRRKRSWPSCRPPPASTRRAA